MADASANQRYDFTPFDCTPGPSKYRMWRRDLFNAAATPDDSGSTIAEHFDDTDMGGAGAGAPQMPAGGQAAQLQADLSKMQRLRLGRSKRAYQLIVKHITDEDVKAVLANDHFQDGQAALAYMDLNYDRPLERSELRELNRTWDDIGIVQDIGVREDTLPRLLTVLRRANGERPAAHRHTNDTLAEKVLECIADASTRFSESATDELNKPAGSRRFEDANNNRLVNNLVAYYDVLWRAEVKAGRLTRMAAQRGAPSRPPRQSIDAARATRDEALRVAAALRVAPAGAGYYAQPPPPRATSPLSTLPRLAEAGLHVCASDTATTTAFDSVDHDTLCAAVEELCTECTPQAECGFTLECVYDAQGTQSIEIVCDNCYGVGHTKKDCPSVQRHRSLQFVMQLQKARFERKEARARQQSRPSGGRRPPPRGQLAPFRKQPPRFQQQHAARTADEEGAHEEKVIPPEEETQRSVSQVAAAAKTESQHAATPRAPTVSMPLSFGAGDDDAYFSAELERKTGSAPRGESMRSATVVPASACNKDGGSYDKRYAMLAFATLGTMLAAACAFTTTAADAALRFTSNYKAHLGTAVIGIVMLCIAAQVHAAPATAAAVAPPLPLAAPHMLYPITEYINTPMPAERALLSSPATAALEQPRVLVVDSGATSGCVSLKASRKYSHIIDKVEAPNPGIEVKVGDAVKLPVHSIVTLIIQHVPGFTIDGDGVRHAATTTMRLKHVLVVDGLDEDILILSVRKMKNLDSIRIFFDEDNTFGVDECLLMPNGTFIPFGTRAQAYEIYLDEPAGLSAVHMLAPPAGCRLRIHASCCHAGRTRIAMSDVTYDGKPIPPLQFSHLCPGCRAAAPRPADSSGKGGGRREHSPGRSALSHYGQLVASDVTLDFPPSFPQKFTAVVNFCDIYSGDRDHYFLVAVDAEEVQSAFGEYHHKNGSLMRDGKVDVFLSDNGTEYTGAGGIKDLIHEMIRSHVHSVPHVSNTNPYPESDHRVMRRAVIATLVYAKANECLWPYAYRQCSLVFHFLATTTHQPPKSAYAFLHPDAPPPDLGWAHVQFCDVTVALPEPDRNGRLVERNVDACYLCYDPARRAHLCYVPSVKRLSTFKVSSWCGEDKFTICAGLTADTPVTYAQSDFPYGPRTASLLPRRFVARRARPAAVMPPHPASDSTALAPPLALAPPIVPLAPLAPPPPHVIAPPLVPLLPPPGAAAPPLVQLLPPSAAAAGVASSDRMADGVVLRAADDYHGSPVRPPPPPPEASALFKEGAYSAVGVGSASERKAARDDLTHNVKRGGTTELEHAIHMCIEGNVLNDTSLVWVHEDALADHPLQAAFFISATAAARITRSSPGATPASLPTTVEEAKGTKYWPLVKEAMEEEIKGKFVDNEAWDVVPRQAWMHVIKSKWVLAFKLNDDHSIKRVKARFVGCGYAQIAGLEYHDVFSSTLASTSLRTLLAIIADEDLETDSVDAKRAFTQSDVDCDIYVEMPMGFMLKGHVLKLKKALEGIKQGSYLWFKLNMAAFNKLGCVASLTDPNVLTHPAFRLILGVFADDVLAGFVREATEQYVRFKEEYAALIKLDHLEITPIAVFIGIKIYRNRNSRTITLTQTPYVERLAAKYEGKFKMGNSPWRSIEGFEKLHLSESKPIDKLLYLSLLGGLLWPANMTRPDVLYAVATLCTFMSCPLEAHFEAGLDILGYIVNTKNLGITYGGHLKVPMGLYEYPEGFATSLGFHVYHDSSWGKVPRPFGGYVCMASNGALGYGSNKVKISPQSTCEAELALAAKASKAMMAQRTILEDMGRGVTAATAMLGDNQACRDVIIKPGTTKLTSYFDRVLLMVKLLYIKMVIQPWLVSTEEMAADIFTKALPAAKFFKFRDYILNVINAPGTVLKDEHGNIAGVLRGKSARLWAKFVSSIA